MHWEDKAIILSVRRLGEHSAIIHLLSAQHGLYAGVDRGVFGKRKRGIYQPGNIVAAHWSARLSEQMGSFTCELVEPVASHVLDNRCKLAGLHSAVQMTEKILVERERQNVVYARLETFTHALLQGDNWMVAYVLHEFSLLEQAGFGLDLVRCAATGQMDDLCYVSPRTGRAVSREAGKPYHDRLFVLPGFLLSRETRNVCGGSMQDILNGLRLCGHFMEERIFTPRNMPLPSARKRWVEMLKDEKEEEVVG